MDARRADRGRYKPVDESSDRERAALVIDDTPASVTTRIADQIQELIASGRISPGLRLGQSELAQQFGVGRLAAREALRLLTAEDVVVHDPNRGFFVAELSSAEARQLFKLRRLFEDDLLRTMQWPSRAELSDLRRRASNLETLLEADQRSVWFQQLRDFHRAIFDLSNDKLMVREALRLWALTNRYRFFLGAPKPRSTEWVVLRKHDLVRALADKDRKGLLAARARQRQLFEDSVLLELKNRGL